MGYVLTLEYKGHLRFILAQAHKVARAAIKGLNVVYRQAKAWGAVAMVRDGTVTGILIIYIFLKFVNY